MLRLIREQEPSKPSTKLSTAEGLPTLAANRGTEPAKLTKLVRGELDWIVMKALEKDRSRRYETANGLAHDIERYLHDDPVQACPPSAAYRFRKFARRNKAGLAVSALVLFFLVVLGSAVGWAARDRAARDEERTREHTERLTKVAGQVELILTEVERLETEQKWPEALAAARRAQAVVAGGEADPNTSDRVRQVLDDLEMVARLEEIRLSSRELFVGMKRDTATAAGRYAAAFRDYGVDLENLPADQAATQLRSRPAISGPLAAALDDWGAQKGDEKLAGDLWKLAAIINPDPWRLRLRQAIVARDVPALLALARAPETARQPSQSQVPLASHLGSANEYHQAIALLERASEADPADFWIHFELGYLNSLLKRSEAAVRHYTAARALRPRSSITWSDLGVALADQNKLDEAIACYHKAIALNSKDAIPLSNLGVALGDQRKLEEAIKWHRKAIALEPKFAVAYSNLGNDLTKQGKLDEAIDCFHKAIALDAKCAAAYANLGIALRKQGKLDEGFDCCRKATELDPMNAHFHCNLGACFSDQKNSDEGIACCRKAIKLDPKLALAHLNLGVALKREKGITKEVIAEYREAVRLDKESGDNPANLASLAQSQQYLGNLYYHIGSTEEAEAALKDAVKTAETLVHDHQEDIEYLLLLADAYSSLGELYHDLLRQADKAEGFHLQVLKIREKVAQEHPNDIHYVCLVGNAQGRLGLAALTAGRLDVALTRMDRAIECLERASNTGHPGAQWDLSNVRLQRASVLAYQGEHTKAIEEAEVLVRKGGLAWIHFYNICCVYSVASDSAGSDSKLSVAERATRRAQYADRAMEYLRLAIARGYQRVPELKSDKDLNPLRSRADFQKLVQELELKTKQVDSEKK
jgi:tetratricopeptide (TPR) repeat protein